MPTAGVGSHNASEQFRTANGRVFDFGATVPSDGTADYAPGCVFVHSDGAAGARLYVNVGSNTSCNFDAFDGSVGSAAGTLKADIVEEYTAATGVTADGVLLKDGGVTATGAVTSTGAVTTTQGVSSGTALVVGGRGDSFTADGSSLTGTTSETVLKSKSIPANTLASGRRLRVWFLVRVTADAGATTLTVRLRLGPTTLTGTALIASTAVDTSADHICCGWFTLTAQAAAGATAACRGFGSFQQPGAAGGNMVSAVLGTGGVGANFATNGALLLELTGQWSAADANACLATDWDVEWD